MKLYVRHAGGELTVPDQKEFLRLWQRGFIAKDDLVRREGIDRWVPAAELPWVRGLRDDAKADNRRLFRLTLALLVLGLAAVLWTQRKAGSAARKVPPAVPRDAAAPADSARPAGQTGVHFRSR